MEHLMSVTDAEHEAIRSAIQRSEVRIAVLEANQGNRDKRLDAIETTLEKIREGIGKLEVRVALLATAGGLLGSAASDAWPTIAAVFGAH